MSAKFQFMFSQAIFKKVFDMERKWAKESKDPKDPFKGEKLVNPKAAAKAS
jgi:hypothetical protein